MHTILDELLKPELITTEDENSRLALIDELQSLLDNLDKAKGNYLFYNLLDFTTIGGLEKITFLIMNSKYDKLIV